MAAAGEKQARTHDAPAPEKGFPETPPDFAAQAKENITAKVQAKADLDAEAQAAVATQNAGRAPLGDEPLEPVAPNRRAEQKGIRQFVREKIEDDLTKPPLPKPPDAITKGEGDRSDRTQLRKDLAGAEASVPRQPIADAREGAQPAYPEALRGASRSDSGLILDKKPAIDPLTGPSETGAVRAEREISEGGDRLKANVKSRALQYGALGAAGAEAGQHIAGLPIPRGVGAVTGGVAGAGIGAVKALSERLGHDYEKGAGAGFKHPSESAAFYRWLRARGESGVAKAGSATDLANRAAFQRWLVERAAAK